jgi:glycosyltransferase involved in cell wall biosynthesis
MENNAEPEISIILPCRNEEQALAFCIGQIKKTIKKNNLSAEIIVSDSSTDKSPEIARKEQVILLKHGKEGYGRAYLEAFKAAKGKYIFMADADGTYDFSEIPNFIAELKKGNDFIMGNRFGGKMEKGAMPFLHKYVGNPVLSFTLRLFFKTKIKDSHCGMRAIRKESLDKLNLQTGGMEFASEMIIKALKNNLKITELPINYYPRKGQSKIKSFSDGWKHLRFMLLYSPLFLFFIPGVILSFIGIISMAWLYSGPVNFFGIRLSYHPMFLSSILVIIGYQLVIFSGFAKTYAIVHLGEKDEKFEKLFKYITIERASFLGILVVIIGLAVYLAIALQWLFSGFGALNEIKNSIVALTLLTIGIQTIFSSFILSILGIKEN